MQNCSRRLAKAIRMMELLEARRRASDDPNLGSNIERLIVARELRDLEQEIARNPGALAAQYALSMRRHGDPPPAAEARHQDSYHSSQ